MIDAQVPAETTEDFSSAATPETLVPGVNPAFLQARLVVPLDMDHASMRWGMTALQDEDTLEALRFASRVPIVPVSLPEAAIRTLLGLATGSAEGGGEVRASTHQVPHADAVIRLRAYLVEAISKSVDRIKICFTGDLEMHRNGQAVARHAIGTVEAEALVKAAVALTGTQRKDDTAGFPVAHRGKHMLVTLEPAQVGVVLLLVPIGPG